MLRPTSVVTAIILCVGTFGCSKKVPECNALIKQLNESSTTMQTATTALMADQKHAKESLDKLASTTKAETEKLAKVELTIPELQGFSKNYQQLLNDTAAAAQAMGKASGDVEGLQEAVTKASTGWMSASTKLSVACIKARKECAALGDKLTKQPSISGIKPDDDAKKLDEYAKNIGSVDAKNPDVKSAVDEIKKTAGDLAAALRKSGEAVQGVEKATKSMTEAGNKEPALIKSINDFCQAG
jgi:DNA repair exonuclease SbcCD ATPase subunit